MLDQAVKTDIDPIRYEMLRHRMFNILEEGRLAIERVSGSPVVVEGGECMCSFYEASGRVILTAAGLLLHCTGCEDAIHRAIEWYTDDPGIHDGDQFFFNDPYIAGTHVYDMVVIKPIFYQGERIAWAGSMMHTSDTGGVLRGAASEIFHEGIRFQGVKIVERGHFRPDVFRSITEQCRDPGFVGLDLKAKIAANNVCSKAYLDLIEKYGLEFVQKTSRKIVDDSEKTARAKLSSLPDGVWRSRLYGFSHRKGWPIAWKAVCTMTKEGDRVVFDFAGSSPQNEDAWNCTEPCAWSSLFMVLAGHLFWDVSWNGGMTAPVTLKVPKGSFLNCNYPAANGSGPATGSIIAAAAHDCIDKMLYAGGRCEDINALWRAIGHPERGRYGGHNQHGGIVAQQIYDFFAGGLGATPARDGVHTGGNMLNPASRVSDVELIEMNYPLLFLSRNELPDSGGYGKYTGGVGMQRIMMVHGSQDLSDTYGMNLGLPNGRGLFGGYPGYVADNVICRSPKTPESLERAEYPSGFDALREGELWEPLDPHRPFGRIPLDEYDIIADRGVTPAGSGYGDPLERDPERVANDVRLGYVSRDTAAKMFGVILDEGGNVDAASTTAVRARQRRERVEQGEVLEPPLGLLGADARVVLRFHESLDIIEDPTGRKLIRCNRCGLGLCEAGENYKRHTARRVRDLHDVRLRTMITEDPVAAKYQEYACPGCGTMLEVDLWIPELDDDEPLWDIQLRL